MKFSVYGTVSYLSYQYLIWKSLFETAPKNVRKIVKEMQLAKDIGNLMRALFDASRPPRPVDMAVLPDAMAWYRVPTDLSALVQVRAISKR
jgi:hypothetical protein